MVSMYIKYIGVQVLVQLSYKEEAYYGCLSVTCHFFLHGD